MSRLQRSTQETSERGLLIDLSIKTGPQLERRSSPLPSSTTFSILHSSNKPSFHSLAAGRLSLSSTTLIP